MSTIDERVAERASWPIRIFRLGAEPNEDLSAQTTPAERLGMMWPLALEAWELVGKPLPDYSRAGTPVRCVRHAELTESDIP